MSLFLTIGAMAVDDPEIMNVSTSKVYTIQFANSNEGETLKANAFVYCDNGDVYYDVEYIADNASNTKYQFKFVEAGTDSQRRKLYYITSIGKEGYYVYNENTSNAGGAAGSVGLTNDETTKADKGVWYIFDDGNHQYIVPAWKENNGSFTRGGCCWNRWSTNNNKLGMWGRGTSDPNYAGDNQLLIKEVVVSEEETAAAREAFNAAYAAAAEIITASEYATTEAQDLPLQTTDSGAAYYIWTNAQEPSEGPISQLVDGNTGNKNFFHTQWSNPVPAGPHYIEVDLGENCNLEFIIRYSTRINTDGTLADFPDAIEIVGSNEKDGTYTQLAIFNEGLPQSQGQYWESTVVENQGYRFLRFNITAEKVFWHMAEFDITIPSSVSVNEGYESLINEIAVLKEAYDNASDNDEYGYYEYVEATNALTTALAAIHTPYTLNVTPAGWATLYLNFPAAIPTFEGEDAGAYIVTGVKEGNWLNLVKVTGVLPANTGVIIKADQGGYTFAYSTNEAANVKGNLLKGTVTDKNIEGEAYVLGYAEGTTDVVFGKAKMNGTYWVNNAYKAYLPVSTLPAGTNAAYYSFRFGENTTAIENVEVENEVKAIYDLTGRRVEAITAPGIYIVNGKKVLVK